MDSFKGSPDSGSQGNYPIIPFLLTAVFVYLQAGYLFVLQIPTYANFINAVPLSKFYMSTILEILLMENQL